MTNTELLGADLDLAVAEAGKEWETAHRFFPTMTLDPTFTGAFIVTLEDFARHCMLRPNNPFRQDPQEYSPSTDWRIGGPIIQREHIHLNVDDGGQWWAERRLSKDGGQGYATSFHRAVGAKGPTPLIAAMRAFVASKASEAA